MAIVGSALEKREETGMRLFIAINMDRECRRRLLAVQDRLRALARRGSYSRPENLHLTLAFLGETAADRLAGVRRAMDAAAVEPLTLTFDRVGRLRGDLWWIAPAENEALLRLQRTVSDRLRAEGFRLEERMFTPHLTLARQVVLSAPPDEAALLGEPFSTDVDHISLMQSQRVDGVLRYTELYQKG